MKAAHRISRLFGLLLSLAFTTQFANAQEQGTGLACGAYRIAHINGVVTDQLSANANLTRLKSVFGNAVGYAPVSYSLA